MKGKIFFLICFLMISQITFSQKKGEKTIPPSENKNQGDEKLFDLNKKIYDSALRYSDFSVARKALYTMIALKPERTGLKDTLTYLYYNSGNHVQVVLIGNEILEKQPERAEILELVGVSQQNLGLLKEALESFEKLYALTKDVFRLYNVATLQYMLKRFGECSETLNSILAAEVGDQKVSISDNSGKSQDVPLKAAAFNMRGVVALEINQPDVAKQNFQKALELYPEFVLAKANLENIVSPKKNPEKKN